MGTVPADVGLKPDTQKVYVLITLVSSHDAADIAGECQRRLARAEAAGAAGVLEADEAERAGAQGDSVALLWAGLRSGVMSAIGAWIVWCAETSLVLRAVKWPGRTRWFRGEWTRRSIGR
jgi:hypothetical protein